MKRVAKESKRMTDDILLDTKAVIALFKNEGGIQERIRKSSKAFVPNVVLGELYFGAFKSALTEKNLERITQLEQTSEILHADCQENSPRKMRVEGRRLVLERI